MNERERERFWSKVREGDGGCWLWAGTLTRRGYGVFTLFPGGGQSQIQRSVHRLAYEDLVGPIPGDLTIDHLCRVRNCVNPEHLEPCPRGLNALRGNGPMALNARKTECKNGHPLSGPNLLIRRGTRQCITCVKAYDRAYKAARRAARQQAVAS